MGLQHTGAVSRLANYEAPFLYDRPCTHIATAISSTKKNSYHIETTSAVREDSLTWRYGNIVMYRECSSF